MRAVPSYSLSVFLDTRALQSRLQMEEGRLMVFVQGRLVGIWEPGS
jgi:hypothetical protein